MLRGTIQYGDAESNKVYVQIRQDGLSSYFMVFSGNTDILNNRERAVYWKNTKDLKVARQKLEDLKYRLMQEPKDLSKKLQFEQLLNDIDLDKAQEEMSGAAYKLYLLYAQLSELIQDLETKISVVSDKDNTVYAGNMTEPMDEYFDKCRSGQIPYYVDISTNDHKYTTNVPNIEFVEKFLTSFLYGFRVRKLVEDNPLQEYTHYLIKGSETTVGEIQWEDKGQMTYHYEDVEEYCLNTGYLSFTLRNYERDYSKPDFILKNFESHESITLPYQVCRRTLGFEMYNRFIYRESTTGSVDFYTSIESVNHAHKDKNYEWLKQQRYEIVTDEMLPMIRYKLRKAIKNRTLIGLDTETTGLNINILSRDGLADGCTGFSLSFEEGEGYYFPLQMRSMPNLYGGDHFAFMHDFQEFFEHKDAQWVLFNVPFDWRVFYIYGIRLHYVYDVYLMFGVTYRYRFGNSFSLKLKELAAMPELLNLHMYNLTDFVRDGKWGSDDEGACFADLPYDFVKYYATADSDMTLRNCNLLMEHNVIERFGAEQVLQLETEFAKCVAYSTFVGMHINMKDLPAFDASIKASREKYRKEVIEEAHKLDYYAYNNPNSADQNAHVLYDVLGLSVFDNPGDAYGKRSTNGDVLSKYASQLNPDDTLKYPFIKALFDYTEVNQICKSFLDKKDQTISYGGLIFSEVSQLGAETGRVLSKKPNYQGFNDDIKQFVSPRFAGLSFDCDFSQIELRVLFSMAKQTNLIELADDPTADLHTIKASVIFNVPYAQVTKSMRQVAKKFNFGVVYGMSLKSMAEDLGLTLSEAKERYKAYASDMPLAMAYMESAKDLGVKQGFSQTISGRRRWYPAIMGKTDTDIKILDLNSVLTPSDKVHLNPKKSDDFSKISRIQRQSCNHLIQGSAADIWKVAVIQLMKVVENNDWWDKYLMCGFIHDEVYGEVAECIDCNDFTAKWREAFEVLPDGFCHLYAGCGFGYSWEEAKHMDLPPLYVLDVIKRGNGVVWDYNSNRFYRSLKENFILFKKNFVLDYLKEHGKNGEVINPVVNDFLKESVDFYKYTDDFKETTLNISSDKLIFQKLLRKSVESYFKEEPNESAVQDVLAYLDEVYVDGKKPENSKQLGAFGKLFSAYFKSKGFSQDFYVKFSFKDYSRGLQDYLKAFCYDCGIDYAQLSVLSAEDVTKVKCVGEVKPALSLEDLRKELSLLDNDVRLSHLMRTGYFYKDSVIYITVPFLKEIFTRHYYSFSKKLKTSVQQWNETLKTSTDKKLSSMLEAIRKQGKTSYKLQIIDYAANVTYHSQLTRFEKEFERVTAYFVNERVMDDYVLYETIFSQDLCQLIFDYINSRLESKCTAFRNLYNLHNFPLERVNALTDKELNTIQQIYSDGSLKSEEVLKDLQYCLTILHTG